MIKKVKREGFILTAVCGFFLSSIITYLFQYVFQMNTGPLGKEKGGRYPPFVFMASYGSVFAAEAAFVARLDGDGDEHRPRENAYRPKRGEAAKDGQDQGDD